nr:hypothetical protein GCM10020241_59910 [Streptoalloteichus tenebrarius]
MRVVIPLFPSFTALDAVGPYEVLRLVPGAEVLFVATEKGEVRADSGALAITADAALDEVDACDVLVVPGGEGSLAPPPELVPWLAKVHATTRWTASVCTGSLLLGAAGILDGLDATTHWGAAQRLEAYGARFLPERVVFQDAHRVVTAGRRLVGDRHGAGPRGEAGRPGHRGGGPARHRVRPPAAVPRRRAEPGVAAGPGARRRDPA